MNTLKKHSQIIFTCMLVAYTFFACLAHLNITFQVLLYAIIIIAPILFDDTKTISTYFYCACFMSCLGGSGFLVALNVSLFLLEVKKLIITIRTKENLQDLKKVVLVWLILLVVLTLYALLYNKFKIYRMGMFIDFVQCCIVLFLVRKNINIKHILFTLFAGIIASVVCASIFNLAHISNCFIKGYFGDRFGAFFNNINTLSVYCTICASSFIVLLLTHKLQFKYYFYFPIITTCFGLLTYSKAFIIVNIVLYVAWAILAFIKSNNKKKFALYSIIGVIVLCLIGFLARSYIKSIIERFTDTSFNSLLDNLTTGRIEIWKQYLKRWLKSPLTFLFGNGYTSQKIATGQYEHSIYIAFLHQFGIVGSIAIIGVLIWTLRKSVKLSKQPACYIPLVLLLINGLVSNLSGVLCTCLVWFLAFYFVTQEADESTEKSIDNKSNQNNLNANQNKNKEQN